MPEKSNRVPSDAAHSMGLLEELECAVKAWKEHPTLLAAARQLRERATTSEGIDKETLDLMKQLEQQLDPLAKLQKFVDDLDPHTLSPEKFKELWSKRPNEIIQGAVEAGRLRERRILLQAKEAETNRRLAYAAFFAALAALAVPFIEKGLTVLIGP
jgi:hypothetical protein